MSSKKLIVLGSVNADHVLQVDDFPRPGETVTGKGYQVIPGGKGANQAVAAVRLGAVIAFIACVGDDDFGTHMINEFAAEGIDNKAVMAIPGTHTGIALIQIAANGENSISLSPEANACLMPDALYQHLHLLKEADTLLMQLETPLDTIELAAREARNSGTVVILNPAPALPFPDSLLKNLTVITPNEIEAKLLTGVTIETHSDAKRASDILLDKGVETVIITLGSKGVFLNGSEGSGLIEGYRVKAVDTTAAGDTFNGALAASLQKGQSIKEAVCFANAAAAISVTRIGAQTSIPGYAEVHDFMKANR